MVKERNRTGHLASPAADQPQVAPFHPPLLPLSLTALPCMLLCYISACRQSARHDGTVLGSPSASLLGLPSADLVHGVYRYLTLRDKRTQLTHVSRACALALQPLAFADDGVELTSASLQLMLC